MVVHAQLPPPKKASYWARSLAVGDAAGRGVLRAAYGTDALVNDRLPLLRNVLAAFIARFGDRPVRVFRCPGRINLRGMHVDTHGGYLNLMTHQREVVVVSGVLEAGPHVFVNIDSAFPEARIDADRWTASAAFQGTWNAYITDTATQDYVRARRGQWSNYLKGSLLRALHGGAGAGGNVICAAVGSDIPRGASLSSSTALSLAVYMSAMAWRGESPDSRSLIPIAQEIEWFTGARIGTSDQSAMLLPRVNELINFAPNVDSGLPEGIRCAEFPAELRVLVINSHTERSLSGAEQLNYTRNRFAYSLALEILRQLLKKEGVAARRVEAMHRLADFSQPALEEVGGTNALYHWLERVPETISLQALRTDYELPGLDELYARYFSPLPEAERPLEFEMRGPLLFGIAESERARLFIDAIESGAYESAGALMRIGHDGDRRFTRTGGRWSAEIGDNFLAAARASSQPIELVPGAYGASSRALDALVDCALEAGALGASLTGAGIAGTVLALCTAATAGQVAEIVRAYIGSDDYGRIAAHPGLHSAESLRDSVVINASPSGAAELRLA